MLVVVDGETPLSPSKVTPATVERYGDEVREAYLHRGDKLTFRVNDGTSEHRFFENGRPDKIKEVLESSESRLVKYGLRADGCTQFTRSIDANSRAATFVATFSDRPDGVVSISVVLKADQGLDVGSDSAVSLVREKMLHAAVRLDPERSVGRFFEVYQDQHARSLRVIVQEDEYGKKSTTHFPNDKPTDDPRYESAKLLAVRGIKRIIELEREIFVNLFPFVAGQTNEDLIDKQRELLYKLSASLFTAFDEVSTSVE